MNTNGMLKMREDTAHISKLDKIVRKPPKKETFGCQPPWLKFKDGKMVEATIEEMEAAAKEKAEAMAEEKEPTTKRLKLLWDIWAAIKQLWTFDREVEGK